MRYRQLRYRYTMLVTTQGLPSLGDALRAERLRVTLAEPTWRPDTDIYETAVAISVMVDLAAVQPDELDIVFFEDALVIEGYRRLPSCEEGGVYHAARIRQGPFRVEILLPGTVDADRADARYEAGLLRITMPKVATGDARDSTPGAGR